MFRLVHVSTIAESLRAFRDQIGFLMRLGVDVHAIASPGAYADELAQSTGVQVHRIEIARPIHPTRDAKSLLELARTLRSLKPDIVHAHTPKGGLLGMWAANLARVPVRIYHLRGLRYVTETGLKRELLKGCERSACRTAHRVLSVSPSLRHQAIADDLVTEDRVTVLGNGGHGLDSTERYNADRLPAGTRERVREKWNIPSDACVIGFVGRMVVDKGIRELWGAWRGLRQHHTNTHLLLVGPQEPEYPLPNDMLQALSNDPRVHWTGPDFNTPPLYAAMDIACLPSYREGLPKMPLEAAAMRLPVVTTNVPGCVDAIVPHETGLLVPVGDVTALQQALSRYVTEPALRQQHGAAGRAWVVRSFQPHVVQQAMLVEYQRLLGRHVAADQTQSRRAA